MNTTERTIDELARNIRDYLGQKGFRITRNSYEDNEWTIRAQTRNGEKVSETEITISLTEEDGKNGWFSFG